MKWTPLDQIMRARLLIISFIPSFVVPISPGNRTQIEQADLKSLGFSIMQYSNTCKFNGSYSNGFNDKGGPNEILIFLSLSH